MEQDCFVLMRLLKRYNVICGVTFRIKKELMALVASLCQDVDYEVRGCMCQQLETIARALG